MRLYHTGPEIIMDPDITIGRKNADFGQGFYLTDDLDFTRRWARERTPYVNIYELDEDDLVIRRFFRNTDWFRYIFQNRRGLADRITADVIIGPIANDTIYDTFGIITSGLLKDEDAIKLLLIGPQYTQIVLKTERAVKNLRWISAEVLNAGEIIKYREIVTAEEEAYQKLFSEEVERLQP
ncbi:MAG: DUF3990 domain-containing protein [Blautia sp.]|nr:DUF3990 domain-containing protein [Blautia sp.]